MHRLLERLDASASTLVPLLYLSGLMLGSVAYFAGLTLNYELAVGIALAAAIELHSFLQQRRARAAYAQLQRLTDTDAEYEAARRQYQVNAWILVGLLTFSGFIAVAYAAETWTPAPGPLWLRWAQIVVRGLAIPALFFLAGFLVPLHLDATDQMRTTSAEMLRRTLKAIDRQWRARLKRAEKRSADLAPVAIALLQESGDHAAAKRLQLIAGGLLAAEQGKPLAALTASDASPALPDGRDLAGIAALPTRHLDHPQPTPAPAAPAALPQRSRSPHDARRNALAASMYTPLEEYEPDAAGPSEDDQDDGLDDDEDDWGVAYTRQPHVTRPRTSRPAMTQRAAKRSSGESAARMEPRSASRMLAGIEIDLPEGRTAQPGDTPEARKVMNYLDKHPGANINEVVQKTKVSRPTVRRYYTSWIERNKRINHVTAAPFTEEMPAIFPDQLAAAAAASETEMIEQA